MFFKRLLLLLLLFYSFLFLASRGIVAQEFKSDYKVEYFLKPQVSTIDTDVKFVIKITNLKSDIYVNKFSLSFPRSFEISDLTASDDNGKINPVVIENDNNIKIELEFANPNTGAGTENNFFLNFKQGNLFKVNANVWEVILPTIKTGETEKYQIVVHLPEKTDKKISIAKPLPTLIQGNTVYWDNPKPKTIYAVFGESQIYKFKLVYNLINPRLAPIYTDIAFPPDTINQKVFVNSINALPSEVFQDADGNYLARYTLKPKENKKIVLKGFVEVSASQRPQVKQADNIRLDGQRKYLLNESKYWKVHSLSAFQNFKTPREIYDYLVSFLKYDYSRVNKDGIERLGAQKAILSPNKAVCTEFSDSFVAIAREKGIISRELQGYGFTQDENLRPLSLVADVLHSWPQYYDENKKVWVSVDPTWENTSGIDYFTSFDLNHIVFAIHGKESDYPLPAGMYKLEDSKDIEIEPSLEIPQEVKKVALKNLDIDKLAGKSAYKGKFKLINEGNVYLYNLPVQIEGQNIVLDKSSLKVTTLAPFEEKELEFTYQALNRKNLISEIKIDTPFSTPLIKQYKLFPILWLIVGLLVLAFVFGGVFIFLRFRFRKT